MAGEFDEELDGSSRTMVYRGLLQERNQDRLGVGTLLQRQGGYNTVNINILYDDSLFCIEVSWLTHHPVPNIVYLATPEPHAVRLPSSRLPAAYNPMI